MLWNELLPKEIVEKANTLSSRAFEAWKQGVPICPPPEQIFRALQLTPPDKVKCVIIGQDPYHTPGQANGLAFSVNNGKQPSLTNIFKELQSDLGVPIPESGDLTPWAEQGVLLLNTGLTTEAHKPAEHITWGWPEVTGAIIKAAAALPQPIAFLLWGKYARKAADGMLFGSPNADNKKIFVSSHPSPYSAGNGSYNIPAFFGSKPFSKVNNFLIANQSTPIDWRL